VFTRGKSEIVYFLPTMGSFKFLFFDSSVGRQNFESPEISVRSACPSFIFFFFFLCILSNVSVDDSTMSNFRANVLETVQKASMLAISSLAIFIIVHPVRTVSPYSSSDSGSPSYNSVEQLRILCRTYGINNVKERPFHHFVFPMTFSRMARHSRATSVRASFQLT